MQMTRPLTVVLAALMLCVAATASAQAPPPYGVPIGLEQAKKIMAGAEAEAKKNNWPVVIAILDSGGQLVMLQRLDNAQWGSVDIAKEKARSAVALRRPTKVFQDAVGRAAPTCASSRSATACSRAASRSWPTARSSARWASPASRPSKTPRSPRPGSTT